MPTIPFDPISAHAEKPGAQQPPAAVRVARTLNEVVTAWQLVYETYCRNGLIDPNPYNLHTVRQAVSPNATVIVSAHGSTVRSTVSAYCDGRLGLPLENVYRSEIAFLRRSGRRLMEVGLFADRRDQITRSIEALFDLMRHVFYFAIFMGVDDALIGVHPHHAPFYIRALAFEKIGTVRTYAMVKDHPVVLLRFDIQKNRRLDPLPKGLEYFVQNAAETRLFDQRYRFNDRELEASPIGRFLAAKRAANAA